jgi:acyl dehydratase
MGLHVEEFEIGRTLRSRGRTVGEGDISSFAGLVGDFNPIHMDEDFSSRTAFGGRIAHGPLTMSMAIGMMSQLNLMDGTALALLSLQWDFQGPVKIGDTISALVTPVEARRARRPGTGVVKFRIEVVNQRGDSLQQGVMTVLMKTRDAGDGLA